MNKNLENKIKQIKNTYSDIEKNLADPNISNEDRIKLSKKFSIVEQIISKKNVIDNLNKEKVSTTNLLKEDVEKEIIEMAKIDLIEIEKSLKQEEYDLQKLLIPKDIDDEKNAILEIRAGTGGDEAALFSMVLTKMYQKFGEKKGWTYEILSFSETNIGVRRSQSSESSTNRNPGKDPYICCYCSRTPYGRRN